MDVDIEKYKFSEREMATKHISELNKRNIGKTITIFDRAYYSIELVDFMIENNKKFLFRLRNDHLRRYHDELKCGENKFFEIKISKENLRYYRDNIELYKKLSSTTYHLRIAKILINDNETSSEEILLTNLTDDEFDIEALKELYHLRWNVETAYNVLKNRMKIEEF